MARIEWLETTIYRIPLTVPVQAASTDVMSEFDLVMVRLRDADGAEGCGYTVLMAGQGASVVAIIDNTYAAIVAAEDPRRIEVDTE